MSRKGRTGASWHPPERSVPPRRDWLVAGLATVGLGVAAYLAATKLAGGSALFCRGVGGCEVVQASRYARFLGLPTAAWGAGLYAAVGGLALAGLGARRWLAAFLLAVAGVAFSAYLIYLELFVIGAVCWYCVVSAATAAGLLGVLLGRRRSVTGPRRFLRPGRVVGLGATTAVATVLLGVGVFAVTDPRAAPVYQEALARHLDASGAIMYGAFW
ncbi:MAG TPA: vitamin K epoxide reductase family protein [Methylomirabilota bacterium]|nr:vitamin K epoxide reductase family protein [Methylomirabilota bacterium]